MPTASHIGRQAAPLHPIFVIAAPGSGADEVVAALGRSHRARPLTSFRSLLQDGPTLTPEHRGFDSARLPRSDVHPAAIERVEIAWGLDGEEHLIATWPEAALQVPFLAAAWPGARFVFLHRDPLESLADLQQAWKDPDTVTHSALPGWSGPSWTGPLVPGWRGFPTDDLTALVCEQWAAVTEIAARETAALPGPRWVSTSLHALVAAPETELRRVGDALGLTWTDVPHIDPPRTTEPLSSEALGARLARIADVSQQARELLDHRSPAAGEPHVGRTGFESVATPNVAQLLSMVSSSVAATTYQSGRVVLLRAHGTALNTHFRALPKPMGIAYRPGALAIGTRNEVVTFVDVPGLAEKAGPQHDSVFVPRTRYATGDIRIHDVGWIGDELWAVNTRFSCLATFDGLHSFVPRWKPSFITALAPEDRCHLNGMAIIDGRVKYVTALGTSNTPGGWRPSKADSGVIIDVETDQIVASGLSMPHSPRWHRDRLWVLESGEGTLATVDPVTGTVTTVATLPGFTRGLAFVGKYAFVGLSQVREATTFGGLPLTARLEERQCGIWIVDIETGQTMGFVRFEGEVQEIFDVTLLPDLAYPELVEPDSTILETAYVVPPGF